MMPHLKLVIALQALIFDKPSEEIYEDLPDYILIFAWGYFPEISDKHRRYFDKGGKAILPLPDVRVNYKPILKPGIKKVKFAHHL